MTVHSSKAARVRLETMLRIFVSMLYLVFGMSCAYAQQLQSALTAFYDYSFAHPGNHVIFHTNDGGLAEYYFLNNSPGWRYEKISSNSMNLTQLIGYSDGQENHVFTIVNAPVLGGFVDIQEWIGTNTVNTFNGSPYATATKVGTLNAIRGSTHCSPGFRPELCGSDFSSIAGYWDGQAGHIYFTDEFENVRELYQGSSGWTDHALGGARAGAMLGEGLIGVFDGLQHVFYIDQDTQHVDELYNNYTYPFTTPWSSTNWTNHSSLGPASVPSYVAATFDAQTQAMQVLAADANAGIQVFNHPNGQRLTASLVNLPSFEGGPILSYDILTVPCPATQPACTPGTTIEAVYIGPSGQLFEFNGSTANAIVQSFPGTCKPATYSVKTQTTIAGFWDGTFRHIFFINGNSHVMELFASALGSWTLNDLSCFAGVFDAAL